VGGRRPALEAVRSGRAREVLMARGARATQGLRSLLAEAAAAGVPVRIVEAADLDALGLPDPQGVAASVAVPPELDERALSTVELGPDALAVVLDGITDPQNLGACARSAEAAGAALLVARRHRSAPTTPAAIRASAGALLHLPVARVANLPRALDRLKDRGFLVVGLDTDGQDFREAPPASRPLALVVGSEGEGLSRLVRERCDLLVALPLAGRTASLNASAALAAGLFAYAVARRA
jgi:23S rRNA (guanosine2251-2'-O)-methyltransferase